MSEYYILDVRTGEWWASGEGGWTSKFEESGTFLSEASAQPIIDKEKPRGRSPLLLLVVN